MRRLLVLSTAMLLAAVFARAASADTLPNQVAVATPDGLVAVTFAANPTRASVADAGAFATVLIRDYGMVGIPSFDPTTQTDSYLVCEAPVQSNELVAVYGSGGQGISEATVVCSSMSDSGLDIRWR